MTPRDDGPWVSTSLIGAGYQVRISARTHELTADEPRDVGGSDSGPTPYEYVLAALGACTAMTLRMYATRKQWPLERVVVHLRHARSYAEDCEHCETEAVGIMTLEQELELGGPLTDDQRRRLAEIAGRCPVKQTLERGVRVRPPVVRAG